MLYSIKKCLECNDFVSGRSDKKFCSDACRTAHHNKTRFDSLPAIKEVNRILIRNRTILMDCCHRRKRKLTEDYLLARGFNFNYFTHMNHGPRGESRVFCYEIGYSRQEKNSISLVKDSEIPKYGLWVLLRILYICSELVLLIKLIKKDGGNRPCDVLATSFISERCQLLSLIENR